MLDPAAPFPVTRAPVENERFRRGADGRFVNLDGSGPHPFKDVVRWAVAETLRVPPPPGAGARLTWLGHASWLVQIGGQSLVIDPVLGTSIAMIIKRNGLPPLAAGALPPIAAQLVSHN